MKYRFEGRLSAKDSKCHIRHYLTMPGEAHKIDIHFRFEPHYVQDIANMLTLTVFDPNGFRGAGHRGGASHNVSIGDRAATPGYLPGTLPAGEWLVQIDTHRIMPGEIVHYVMDVVIEEQENLELGLEIGTFVQSNIKPRSGPAWYRGDLHSHTHHSDASSRSVAELIQTARDQSLDFVFLTDHNTTAGLDEMYASATDDFLAAGGMELTTYWGHALCLGTREWVDWRIRPRTDRIQRIANSAHSQQQVFIIAHPQAMGDPFCTGCTWRFGEMMPGSARFVEVWNKQWHSHSNNERALSLWYDWLNQGARLVATAGSDTHKAADYDAKPGFNVIYADELSETSLLKALNAGHLYLSCGPKIVFEAEDEHGGRWMMGDTVTQTAAVRVAWENCERDVKVRLIANGSPLKQLEASKNGNYGWTANPDEFDWILVEIRDANDKLLAITNPLFLQSTRSRNG